MTGPNWPLAAAGAVAAVSAAWWTPRQLERARARLAPEKLPRWDGFFRSWPFRVIQSIALAAGLLLIYIGLASP